jgi:hypothetical protein
VQFDARKYSYKQHNNIYSACIEPKKQASFSKKKTNFAVETKWIMINYKVGYDHMQLLKERMMQPYKVNLRVHRLHLQEEK